MLKKLWAWITGATSKIKQALTFGKDVANQIKGYADSPLLDVVVKLTNTKLDDAALASFRTFMAVWVEKLNWAEKKVSELDMEEKIVIFNTLAAGASYWMSQKDRSGLNLQTTLSASQLVYEQDNIKLDAM